MVRVIEARAIISAADKTGGAFNAVAEKIRRMSAAAKSANSVAASAARHSSTIERASGMASRAAPVIAGASAKVLGAGGAAYAASSAIKRFAAAEDVITRIGVNADASDDDLKKMMTTVRNLAFQSGKSFDEVAAGLESLVAGGQELPDALKALPAIAKTGLAASAQMKDLATTSLALNQSLGIGADKMQSAFDIMVTGGKEGKFELRDMAQYFASLAPQAATLGLKGETGLQRMVALLQTIRAGTGTAEEAASGFRDLMSKMETDETQNKFKKFGVDIRKELAAARKEGQDLFETFTEAARKATKGDMSKLPQLLGDLQGRTALLALMSYGELLEKITGKLRSAADAGDRDAKRMARTTQFALNQLSESFDRLKALGGEVLSHLVSKDMDAISSSIEKGFSDGMVAGFKDFIAKIQPGEGGDLVGQATTAMMDVMGMPRAAPMFTPEKRKAVEDEQETRRDLILRDRIARGEAEERYRKGADLAPLAQRIRENPEIADAREGLFSLKKQAAVPFGFQASAPMAKHWSQYGADYMASIPKAPPGWMDEARRLADRTQPTGAEGIPGVSSRFPSAPTVSRDDLAELTRGLPEALAAIAESFKGQEQKDAKPVKAEVSGEAQIHNSLAIDVNLKSDLLEGKIRTIAREEVKKLPLRGVNGPGTTGVSSADARASDVWRW